VNCEGIDSLALPKVSPPVLKKNMTQSGQTADIQHIQLGSAPLLREVTSRACSPIRDADFMGHEARVADNTHFLKKIIKMLMFIILLLFISLTICISCLIMNIRALQMHGTDSISLTPSFNWQQKPPLSFVVCVQPLWGFFGSQ
jgi:hypothetical protein